MAALGIEEKGAVVVTAAEGWHPGVVGLVAARLKERFGRPAFAIALEPGGIGTGSGRSIAGRRSRPRGAAGGGRGAADQGRRPRHGGGRHAAQGRAGAVSCFSRGHPGACGRGRAARRCAADRRRAHRRLLRRRRLSPPSRSAGPFGAGNPEPVVALPAHTLAYADEVGQAHVRVRLRSGDGAMRQCDRLPRGRPETRRGAHENRGRACMSRAVSRSTVSRARSGCSCGYSMWRRRGT